MNECYECSEVIEDEDYFWRLTCGRLLCERCMKELHVGPYRNAAALADSGEERVVENGGSE